MSPAIPATHLQQPPSEENNNHFGCSLETIIYPSLRTITQSTLKLSTKLDISRSSEKTIKHNTYSKCADGVNRRLVNLSESHYDAANYTESRDCL
jgi:hypothetical protein